MGGGGLAAEAGDVGHVLAFVQADVHRRFQRGDFQQRRRGFGAGLVVGVHGNGDGRQDADDRDDDHQFDQGDTSLPFHERSSFVIHGGAVGACSSFRRPGRQARSRPEPTPFVTPARQGVIFAELL